VSAETVTWVTDCADLRIGEFIKARVSGQQLVRGEVAETMPHQGLLWIHEESLGDRLLLDMSEVEILRIRRAASPNH